MNPVTIQALLITGVITFLLEAGRKKLFPVGRPSERVPRPVLAIGMLLGIAAMEAVGNHSDAPYPSPPYQLAYILIAGVLMMLMVLPSDRVAPSSRRHFIATMLAGVILAIGGAGIRYIGLPGIGQIALPGLIGILATLIFLFVIVGIVEICSQLPLLTGIIAVVVGLTVFLPVETHETFSGRVLCGVLIGGLIGRFLGEAIHGQSRTPEKTEILITGYLIAAACLTMFLKSFAVAGFVIPLTFIVLLVIVLAMQSFDKSVILRPSPRE